MFLKHMVLEHMFPEHMVLGHMVLGHIVLRHTIETWPTASQKTDDGLLSRLADSYVCVGSGLITTTLMIC